MALPWTASRVIAVARRDHGKAWGQGHRHHGTLVPQMADPVGLAIVRNNGIETPVGKRLYLRQCVGCRLGIRMIQRLQNRSPRLRLSARRAQGAVAVQDCCHHPVIIESQPAPPGQQVLAGNDVSAIGPVTSGWPPRAIRHFIAIGGQQERPLRAGAPK